MKLNLSRAMQSLFMCLILTIGMGIATSAPAYAQQAMQEESVSLEPDSSDGEINCSNWEVLDKDALESVAGMACYKPKPRGKENQIPGKYEMGIGEDQCETLKKKVADKFECKANPSVKTIKCKFRTLCTLEDDNASMVMRTMTIPTQMRHCKKVNKRGHTIKGSEYKEYEGELTACCGETDKLAGSSQLTWFDECMPDPDHYSDKEKEDKAAALCSQPGLVSFMAVTTDVDAEGSRPAYKQVTTSCTLNTALKVTKDCPCPNNTGPGAVTGGSGGAPKAGGAVTGGPGTGGPTTGTPRPSATTGQCEHDGHCNQGGEDCLMCNSSKMCVTNPVATNCGEPEPESEDDSSPFPSSSGELVPNPIKVPGL